MESGASESKEEARSDSEQRSTAHDLILLLGGVGLAAVLVAGVLLLWIGHRGVHHQRDALLASQHESHASALRSDDSGTVTPSAPPVSDTSPEGPNTDSDKLCSDVRSNPNAHSLQDALLCLGVAVATGVAAVIKAELIASLISTALWTCVILPIVLLLLAWILSKLADYFERTSKHCRKRKHWWQRLWCRIKRVLVVVFRIVAVLAVIATIISVIVCIISLIALFLVI